MINNEERELEDEILPDQNNNHDNTVHSNATQKICNPHYGPSRQIRVKIQLE